MNIIAISGNLTATPELKTTQNGVAVCSFSVAVRRPRVKDTTDFINCVAWRSAAEFVSRYFQKGQRIEVAGILTTRSFEDKNGNKRTAYEVLCDDISFGDRKSTETEAPRPAFSNATSADFEEIAGDEDLPF